jgi:hypothetical protein
MIKENEEKLSYKKMMSTQKGQAVVYKTMSKILEMFGKWKKAQIKKQEVNSVRKKINKL